MFLWCSSQWECDQNLHFTLTTTIEDICKYEGSDLYPEWIKWIEGRGLKNLTEWISLAAKMDDKIQECKTKFKKYMEHFISISLKSDLFKRKKTMKFLDLIHGNMNELASVIKSHIEIPLEEERLFLLRDFIHFTPKSGSSSDLRLHVHDWANKAACVVLLHWLNDKQDEKTGEILKGLHLELLHKTNPCSPEFIKLCFGVIKVPKLKRSDTLIFGEFVSRFVDFFLENMVFTLKDNVPMLREGLIFFITFLADPPANAMKNSELSSIQKQIHALLDQASHAINLFGETSMDLTTGRSVVVDLRKSIDEFRGKIERLYVQIPYPSWSNFPRTNGLGHFESLLVYLEYLMDTMNKNKKLVPFLKHRIFTIKEELMLLQDIWKMQNEHDDVKGLWDQILSLSYQADLAIKSSFFIDHSIWYNLTCLSFIVEKIKDIQSKVMGIKETTSTSKVEVVVGFKRETVLFDRLIGGTKPLDIVPIVGMGGIGKTTLAKTLFNEPSVISHFHKRAFCTVSQEYRKRNVLLDILTDLCKIDDEFRQMSDDDLAHKLKKCLSGCKYLIVLDDIWDIDAWYNVRASFPDDNNGSKVIFTTRINNISLIAKSNSIPYQLPFLSLDESLELLKQKIFHNDPCPPQLCKVVKLIAEKCQGLPLAIVVIAGLLTRTERSLTQWNEVADALTSFASSEGCKDVIILSYKKLPDALKSCFLYLGAFREDEKIKAKMLTKLWVAEGFVLKYGSNLCLRKVAKEYLNELGERNLITVTKRGCNGGIKRFRLHDVIRDFCRTEAQEQHYLCFVNATDRKLSDQYRVCIEEEWRSFVVSKPRGPNVHSLIHYSKDYCKEMSLASFMCNFKLVQVLDLRMVEIVGGFPTTITTLVHLRYLALRLADQDKPTTLNVPSEISNLWNLETLLLLRRAKARIFIIQFPKDIWKMKRLRHVETRDLAYVALGDVSGVLAHLPDLDTFTTLAIPPGNDGEELLRRLSSVRKLRCCFSGDAPKLDILTNLESLHIVYSGEGFCNPQTFSFPLTTRKLTLESFHIHWEEFSAIIQKMPSLQALAIRGTLSSNDAKIWDVQDEEFRNIKSLKLKGLDIREWKASVDTFPCLEKVEVSCCNDLIEVPPCFGEVLTLKSIMVTNCNKALADSALQIQTDQLDWENQINLQVRTYTKKRYIHHL